MSSQIAAQEPQFHLEIGRRRWQFRDHCLELRQRRHASPVSRPLRREMRAKPLQQTGCVRAPSEQSRLVVEERLFDYDAAILPEAAQGRSGETWAYLLIEHKPITWVHH